MDFKSGGISLEHALITVILISSNSREVTLRFFIISFMSCSAGFVKMVKGTARCGRNGSNVMGDEPMLDNSLLVMVVSY